MISNMFLAAQALIGPAGVGRRAGGPLASGPLGVATGPLGVATGPLGVATGSLYGAGGGGPTARARPTGLRAGGYGPRAGAGGEAVGWEWSQSDRRVRSAAIRATGWSSMMWWPAAGISMTGATRPRRSYMTWLICTDMMPCSARNRATRQSSRVSMSAAPNGSRAKIRRSNFQVQPLPSGV